MATLPPFPPKLKRGLDLITLAYIPLLFFNAGHILSERFTIIDGWYSNYYQIRLTLALLLGSLVVIAHRANWKKLWYTLPLWGAHFVLVPEPLLAIRIWKALLFSVAGYALLISLQAWLTPMKGRLQQFAGYLLVAVLGLEALLIVAQTWLQESLPGIWWSWLGQPAIPSPGGAQEVLASQIFPRLGQWYLPYGTLPHPNIAAGLALLLLLLLMQLGIKRRGLVGLGLISAIVIIFLSFSQAAWLVLGIWVVLWLGKKYLRVIPLLYWNLAGLGLLLAIPVGLHLLSTRWYSPSWYVRDLLNTEAWRAATTHFWGLGWYGFIPHIITTDVPGGLVNQYWQPAHNIWLLTLSEWGILCGSVFWVLWGWLTTQLVDWKKVSLVTVLALGVWLIVLGSLDHYLFTYLF